MSLKGKRIGILVEQSYNEFEVWYPFYRFKEEGADVRVIGTGSSDVYESKAGLPIRADVAADKVLADEFDAVIIPGGWAPDYLRRYDSVLKLVRDMYQKNKVVASICHGGWVLASSGILKGKRVTCFFAIKDDVKNAGAEHVDQEVVRDGNLITSRKPEDLPAFCREIIGALNEMSR